MTRRLALVIVGVVLATLLIAGGGTLALAAVRARHTTEAELLQQTEAFAANIGEFLDTGQPVDTPAGLRELRARLRTLQRMKSIVPLDVYTVMVADKQGVFNPADLPPGLVLTTDELASLSQGQTVSGLERRTAYAGATASTPNGRLFAVVATRPVDAGLGAAVRLFLWASVATIVLALGAATLLGRRLSKPVRDTSAAAQRIAGGDLSVRLPDHGGSDELAQLQRSVNHMADSLDASRTLEQQFLLSVSHDLRTPLTSIRGYADAIGDGTIEPARAAGVIRSESRRLERLVADLLELAKLQARSFTFRPERIDLSESARTAVDGAAGSVDGVTVHAVTTAPVMVTADPDRVAQVLANLVENGAKYAAGNVYVSCRSEGGWAVCTVDDDGPGIPAEALPHVFERLYTARQRPERAENPSGLGLAIVKELVTAMGGDVAAGARPGGGARFTVRLPLA
ncbi:MAG: sensor histidine kinase [Ilumatobacteraceae bacterium]